MPSSVSRFCQVLPHEVEEAWPLLLPFMESFAHRSGGRFLVEDYHHKIKSNYMQCWLSLRDEKIEACGLTEIVVYPRVQMLRICGGTGQDRKNWQTFENSMAIWAQANGCDGVESIARKGWLKIFQMFGYKQTHIFIERMFA